MTISAPSRRRKMPRAPIPSTKVGWLTVSAPSARQGERGAEPSGRARPYLFSTSRWSAVNRTYPARSAHADEAVGVEDAHDLRRLGTGGVIAGTDEPRRVALAAGDDRLSVGPGEGLDGVTIDAPTVLELVENARSGLLRCPLLTVDHRCAVDERRELLARDGVIGTEAVQAVACCVLVAGGDVLLLHPLHRSTVVALLSAVSEARVLAVAIGVRGGIALRVHDAVQDRRHLPTGEGGVRGTCSGIRP